MEQVDSGRDPRQPGQATRIFLVKKDQPLPNHPVKGQPHSHVNQQIHQVISPGSAMAQVIIDRKGQLWQRTVEDLVDPDNIVDL